MFVLKHRKLSDSFGCFFFSSLIDLGATILEAEKDWGRCVPIGFWLLFVTL